MTHDDLRRAIETLELVKREHSSTDSSQSEVIQEAIEELKQLEENAKTKPKPDKSDRKAVLKVLGKVVALFNCVKALAELLSNVTDV